MPSTLRPDPTTDTPRGCVCFDHWIEQEARWRIRLLQHVLQSVKTDVVEAIGADLVDVYLHIEAPSNSNVTAQQLAVLIASVLPELNVRRSCTAAQHGVTCRPLFTMALQLVGGNTKRVSARAPPRALQPSVAARTLLQGKVCLRCAPSKRLRPVHPVAFKPHGVEENFANRHRGWTGISHPGPQT